MIQTVNPQNLLRRTQAQLKRYLIQEIPEGLSPCEFDCHQASCTYAQADTCKKRRVLLESRSLNSHC